MNNDDVFTAVPRISRLKESTVIGESEGEMLSGLKGDFRSSAPEVIQGLPYGKDADCWSFGVIMFYILAGALPFNATNYGP